MSKAEIFIFLSVELMTPEPAVGALDALFAELEAKGIAVKGGSWGYRLLVVDDLDGSQPPFLPRPWFLFACDFLLKLKGCHLKKHPYLAFLHTKDLRTQRS